MKVGDRVKHPTFGEGTVTGIIDDLDDPSDLRVTTNFEEVGIKVLRGRYAKLKLANDGEVQNQDPDQAPGTRTTLKKNWGAPRWSRYWPNKVRQTKAHIKQLYEDMVQEQRGAGGRTLTDQRKMRIAKRLQDLEDAGHVWEQKFVEELGVALRLASSNKPNQLSPEVYNILAATLLYFLQIKDVIYDTADIGLTDDAYCLCLAIEDIISIAPELVVG